MNAGQLILVGTIKLYQRLIMPMFTAVFAPMGLGCRFHPNCSTYATDAVCKHGAIKGAGLAVWRLCRCHPLGGYGMDPVPKRSPRPRRSDAPTLSRD